MEEKIRLDMLLKQKGYAESREQAKTRILAGEVYVNGVAVTKASALADESDNIEIRGEGCRFVGRGGYKLDKAIGVFSIQLQDKTVMDIGASTGGFTDCMLQYGASKVYAIDAGFGQLAEKLRNDSRVINLEHQNIRTLTENEVDEKVDFISVDVSFISIEMVLPVMIEFLKPNGEAVCLIKPQFEVGKGRVGKKGVVKDARLHKEVLTRVIDFAVAVGFSVCGADHSPIKGGDGNIEYLLYLKNDGSKQVSDKVSVGNVVENAHKMKISD